MGLKHEARPGRTIQANGVLVTVLRGRPQLEVTAPREVVITIGRNPMKMRSLNKSRKSKRSRPSLLP